ncbi:hypothetical protein KCU87_g86, partial [Aureobasidium melanogenum]
MLDCYTGTLLTVTALSSSNNTQRHPESTSPHHALSKDTNTKALLQRPATKARSFNENPPSKQAVLGREVSESEKMREGERKPESRRQIMMFRVVQLVDERTSKVYPDDRQSTVRPEDTMGDRGRKAWMTEIMEDLEDRVHELEEPRLQELRGTRVWATLVIVGGCSLDSLIRSPGGQLPTIVRIARIAVPGTVGWGEAPIILACIKVQYGSARGAHVRPEAATTGAAVGGRRRRSGGGVLRGTSVSASASTSTLVDTRVRT